MPPTRPYSATRAPARSPQQGGDILTDAVLVLNAGSSSVKFSTFPSHDLPTPDSLLCEGQCEGISHKVRFTATDRVGTPLVEQELADGATHERALAAILR